MLTIKTRVEKEYQNFVILNFFILHLKSLEISIDYFNRKVDYLFLVIKINNTLDLNQFNKIIQKEWSSFLKLNKKITQTKPQEKAENLFKLYPLGDLKILRTDSEGLGSDKNSINLTKVHLEILHFLDNQKENEEHLLNLFLVFVYVSGGYSPKKIIELCEYFLENINFDKQTRILLDEQVNNISIESKEFLVSHISTIYNELLNFYEKGQYPSLASKWKYSFKHLNGLGNLTLNKNNIQPFKQLRNQLNILDSESYVVLSLIHHYFKNSL
jgi:hypothetical protein